jgi:YbbR domain-containing protein
MNFKELTRIKSLLLAMMLFVTLNTDAFGQVATTELRISEIYLFDIKVELKDDRYTISMDTNGASSSNSITVTNFTSSVFQSFVISTMKVKNSGTFVLSDGLKNKVNTRFIELMAALINTEQKGQKIAS